MIVGVGVDLARVSRIDRALHRHGSRFARRILRPPELRAYLRNARPAAFLARRFAAKEATAKAFGTGIGAQLGWHDVAVTHGERGQPALSFAHAADALCRRLGVEDAHLSIADDGDYAIAFVVLSGVSV